MGLFRKRKEKAEKTEEKSKKIPDRKKKSSLLSRLSSPAQKKSRKKSSPEKTPVAAKAIPASFTTLLETKEKKHAAVPLSTSQKKEEPSQPLAANGGQRRRDKDAAFSSWKRRQDLPDNYGDNMIYLLVRDPYWVYAFWEIQKDHQEAALGKLGGSWDEVRSVLRVYDVTSRTGDTSFYDISLFGLATNWYLEVQPNRSYFVEIGLLHRDGRFIVLARSNEITTPRAGMSEILDEEWMGIDFDKIYALSGGFDIGKSSMELRKLMEERLRGAISSGSGAGMLSSFGSPVRLKKKRGFWFVLDCELIVYGATEPDATVTMQGKPVKLRPDGTFTLRYAFPDGKQVLNAHAYSADGIEERVITPVVERQTERPAPVLKA